MAWILRSRKSMQRRHWKEQDLDNWLDMSTFTAELNFRVRSMILEDEEVVKSCEVSLKGAIAHSSPFPTSVLCFGTRCLRCALVVLLVLVDDEWTVSSSALESSSTLGEALLVLSETRSREQLGIETPLPDE